MYWVMKLQVTPQKTIWQQKNRPKHSLCAASNLNIFRLQPLKFGGSMHPKINDLAAIFFSIEPYFFNSEVK